MARRLLVAVALLILAAGTQATSHAQETPPTPLQVELKPVGDATVSGLVLLSPAGNVTAVQVLVMGASPGTAAMIHRGTCNNIDPAPVALLGDVGVTAQIQTTAPFPYTTLTSGGYLVALHAGLGNLSMAIACGEIPAADDVPPEPPTEEPSPTPDGPPDPPTEVPTEVPTVAPTPATDPVRGNTYTSPAYGYSFSWDDTWTVQMAGTVSGGDLIRLSGPNSILSLFGFEGYGGDPAACLTDSATQLRSLANVQDVVPFEDGSGHPTTGNDTYSMWAAFAYTNTGDNASTGRRVDYDLCRRLSATAILLVVHETFEDGYDEAAAARDAVLATLSVPGQPTVATPEPDDCAGVATWFAPTYERIDRMQELIGEALVTPGAFILAFWTDARVEITEMVRLQRAEPAPPSAVDINNRIIAILDTEIDLLDRSIDLLKNHPGNADGLYAIGKEGTANAAIVESLAGELKALAKKCDIPVPD